MKNKAIDVHNHLMEQLERINDMSVKGEKLDQEIKRADAMIKITQAIVANNRVVVDALKMAAEYGISSKELPDNLSGGTATKLLTL